ncbi:hypothetical protein [uncultured Actinomyces sp.]|uniref:hypothetical protein n=1 Tax=uncultured Actinomyces sp. TaxID=249061 RepID=UPI0028D88512|nr:hypothetical protein [uncultured Actinomyces sp.]
MPPQHRFGFADPSGLWVDVVEQVEPEPGYWNKYMQGAGDGQDTVPSRTSEPA